LSLIKPQNYKKHVGTPDSIYLKPVDLYCYLCTNSDKPGPTKRRKCLWQLSYHLRYTHSGEFEEEWQRFVNNLYELIKNGVIR